MRRFLILVLVMVMAFTLISCGEKPTTNTENNQQETMQTNTETMNTETIKTKTVVGKWIYNNGETFLIINEDNTGETLINGNVTSLTWQYNSDTQRLTLTNDDFTKEATYKEDEDVLYMDECSYIRTDNETDVEMLMDLAKKFFVDMVNAEYASDTAVVKQYLPGIVCWGDSLTAGAGGSGVNYPKVLQAQIEKEICSKYKLKSGLNSSFSKLLNSKTFFVSVPVVNMGVGGETTNTTIGRNGAIPFVVSEQLTIPAEITPVEISFISENGQLVGPLRQGDEGVNPVTIDGIEGTLTIDKNSYYFTRTVAGEEKTISVGTKIITAASSQYLDYIPVIFMGTNGGYETPEELISQQRAIINHQTANKDRFIIIGLHTGTEASRKELEEAMENEYGKQYINLRQYMATQAMSDSGLEPTQKDMALMKKGSTPDSLLYDGVHFNSTGYTLIGKLIFKTMDELGYFNEVREALTHNFG